MKQALPINSILDGKNFKYRIEEVLGQGSFGITYKARGYTKVKGAFGEMEIEFPQPLAIKEFYMKDINSRNDDGSIQGLTLGGMAYNYAQKFRKEAEKLATMNHPNIVKVFDFIETNNTFYYVMEYIDGVDINHYMNGTALSSQEAISIARSVAQALDYMHTSHSMLHLDLKPGNIMRGKDGHIFLIDFGLSKHYSDDGIPDTSTTIGLATEGYAPLEQGKRSAAQNLFRPTIDVYALGGTLFKMLTGNTPPVASDILEDDELLEHLMISQKVDQHLRNIVISAMKPIVKKRTQTVSEFLQQLDCFHNITDTIELNEATEIKENKEPIESNVTISQLLVNSETIETKNEQNLNVPKFIHEDEYVDLGLNVKWRNRNLGATKPEDFGSLKTWGEDYEKTIINEQTNWYIAHECISGTELDPVFNELKDGSKLPTMEQFNELIDKCQWLWSELYGANGYKIIGPNGQHIFLPASGKSYMDKRSFENNRGYYWCGNKSHVDKCSYYIMFDNENIDIYYEPYYIQRSIRPIKEK